MSPIPMFTLGLLLVTVAPVAVHAQVNVDSNRTGARTALSLIQLGDAKAAAGTSVSIPVSVRDAPGTPLGPEKPGADVQSIALRIRVSPSQAVVSVHIERAGIATAAVPRFEVSPRSRDGVSWLAVFDDPAAPLLLPPRVTSVVATLHLTLATNLLPAQRIELRLDPDVSVLANAAGSVHESVSNGWLELRNGQITVR